MEALQFGEPLLVVDDGSTDATANIAGCLPINVIHHRSNRGKGAALRTGFDWALEHCFSGVITMDADGQHDPSAIPLLVETARERRVDLLIGSRYCQFQEMAGLRAFWNRFGVWCVRRRTGLAVSDSQSGLRYYSARLLRDVRLTSTGYDLEMEIVMKAWRQGFAVDSVPVAARVADGRATSHYRPVRDTWNICMTFLRFMRKTES